jgi:hypothetical protein
MLSASRLDHALLSRIIFVYVCDAPMLGGFPCHHSMARPRAADGRDGLQLWRLAANILNKQPRTNDKGKDSNRSKFD